MTVTIEFIGSVLALLVLLASLIASGHAVLYKRDSRAAISWTGLIWLAPFVGTVLYVLLGINRIERRARHLRTRRSADSSGLTDTVLSRVEPDVTAGLKQLSRLVGNVTDQELTCGNVVEPLCGGDKAYPAMLDAIQKAGHTIGLSTYIFDEDDTGMEFAAALAAAVNRGVQVCVLIDAVGAKYALSSMVTRLEELNVPVRTFNPPIVPWRFRYANLRNHRKILTIDGTVAFTGGMNIRGCCVTSTDHQDPVNDLHFRLEGPIVSQVQDTFVSDWTFATEVDLTGDGWYPELKETGNCATRGIADGPDESVGRLRLTLLGACQSAERTLKIVTPYFLPDSALISALNVAALRGVTVEILIPEHSNERLVEWACNAQLWQIVTQGCHVRRTQQPFDHSKLVIVDDEWVLMGSANWDPRSLRLNFEFNVECYNHVLAMKMADIFESKKQASSLVTLDELQSVSLPARLRNGIARLAMPFL